MQASEGEPNLKFVVVNLLQGAIYIIKLESATKKDYIDYSKLE